MPSTRRTLNGSSGWDSGKESPQTPKAVSSTLRTPPAWRRDDWYDSDRTRRQPGPRACPSAGATDLGAASKTFAQGASGSAHAFISVELASPGSIWANTELPALVENPNVTDVIFHLIGG